MHLPRWRKSGTDFEELLRASRPEPRAAFRDQLVRMIEQAPSPTRRGVGHRGALAGAFSALVLAGLAAGGAVGYGADLVSSSAVAIKGHVLQIMETSAPSVRWNSAAIAQYGEPPSCPKCNQAMAATDQLVVETRALAGRITNPVAKAAVLNALALAAQMDTQVTALVHQAAATKNPVVRAQLLHAAEVSANAAKALAVLAHSFATATLKAEGKQP